MGEEKLWADVAGHPLLALTLDAIAEVDVFDMVVVVAPRSRWRGVTALARQVGIADVLVVQGGDRRQESVRAGIQMCATVDHVCVHDAARPLCPLRVFRDVLEAARAHGAATAAIPQVDTTKRVADGAVVATIDRSDLVAVQTPQAFETGLIVEAHRRALAGGYEADDDCSLVERIGHEVRVVAGDPHNFKVTRPQDLTLLRALVARAAADR